MYHGKHSFEDFLQSPVEKNYEVIGTSDFGGRKLLKPKENLKLYHRFLNLFLFELLPINERVVFSYRKGFSAVNAVQRHTQSKYFFQTDIQSFFDSIDQALTKKTILAGESHCPIADLSAHLDRIVNLVCIDDSIPVGLPASAPLSNAVLLDFDNEMERLCQERDLSYSRYADDIIISGQNQDAVQETGNAVQEKLHQFSSEKFFIHQGKTRFFQVGGKIKILGMLILPNGRISIDTKKKKELEVLLFFYLNDREKFKNIVNQAKQRTDAKRDLVEDDYIAYLSGVPYYVIPYDDDYYLREDHFSSGEYFLISLYRRIRSHYLAIFIDEIDISLDAAAQVRLVEWLRRFKDIYQTKFVFTTHSLAMMRTVSDELFYMEEQADGAISIERKSYGFVKSTLFGFNGWEKYILTEDAVLSDFLKHLIDQHCARPFYQFKIIFVGGSKNTTDLMQRNKSEKFLTEEYRNVIVVLDGDQRKTALAKKENVFCIPMESVEKELLTRCLKGEFWDTRELQRLIPDHDRLQAFSRGEKYSGGNLLKRLFYQFILIFRKDTEVRRKLSAARGEPIKERDFSNAGKRLFAHLTAREFTQQQIFDFLIEKNPTSISSLLNALEQFLSTSHALNKQRNS